MSASTRTLLALQRYTVSKSIRRYSTTPSPSLIQTTDIPAPSIGHIKLLLLNRPSSKNALSLSLLTTLRQTLEDVASEGGKGATRALIIGSTSDVFCAGADLKERKTFTPKETTKFLALLNSTFSLLASLQIPTLSAITSHALGGGLELALCTDLRITTPKASLGLPETRLAIIPGAGGTYRLPPLIGTSRALEMMYTGRRVGASEALNWGLVNKVTAEGEDVNEKAVEWVQQWCEGGPLALTAVKRAVVGREGGLGVEQLAYATLVESEDKYEALKAFGEKRAPVYKGR